MIFRIETLNTSLPISSLEDNIKSKCFRYLNLLQLENSKEFQNWDRYLKTVFDVSLYKALYNVICYLTLQYDENGYGLKINSVAITDTLKTDQLCALMISGNLSIRKSYIISNMIEYAISNL